MVHRCSSCGVQVHDHVRATPPPRRNRITYSVCQRPPSPTTRGCRTILPPRLPSLQVFLSGEGGQGAWYGAQVLEDRRAARAQRVRGGAGPGGAGAGASAAPSPEDDPYGCGGVWERYRVRWLAGDEDGESSVTNGVAHWGAQTV